MIDIIKIFSDAADAADYRFAYGRKDILSYESGNMDLSSGESVLMVFPFIENAQVNNGIIHKWSVSTQLWLGRKFETNVSSGTYSQLDETELQKYDRRLYALRSAMETMIKSIFCTEDLELTAARVFREINQFDENLDFVTAEITFTYDS